MNNSNLSSLENLIDTNFNLFSREDLESDVSNFLSNLKIIVDKSSKLILKQIKDLLNSSFYVAEYQRGYKWAPEQVEHLLYDILKFNYVGDSFYCLQPIVVKRVKKDSKLYWELVDGQQRMTTIYMILKYLDTDGFSLNYQTRDSSSKFLSEQLSKTTDYKHWEDYICKNEEFDNVDNYHFYNAYIAIDKFFSTKNDEEIKVWKNKLLNHTKIIWYAIDDNDNDENSIDIFLKLNSGKIPLTNAELIKALLLHKGIQYSNTTRQNEIAQEWDNIEHTLQNNEFWSFFNSTSKSYNTSTRIEVLFEILAKQRNMNEDKSLFDVFQTLIQKTDQINNIETIWVEIKKYFYLLREWYDDNNTYHLVGYILLVKFKTIYEIFKIYEECEKKIDFKKKLEKIISEQLKKYLKNDENDSYSLENLQYGTDNRKIVHILILFNIYAYKNANSKIPFKLFARSWSLEHIHAQNTQDISEDSKFKVWKIEMENLLRELPDENKDLFDTLNKINNDKELIEEFEKELEFITGEFIEEDKMHSLSNLTLLSKELNSSLGNKVFFQKRKQIMEWEKVTNDDFFIPLATKNIFAKYYSENIEHVLKWSNTDKESYEKKLLECLSQYLVIEG